MKIEISIPAISDKLFNDKEPIPIDKTIEDDEYKEQNEELQDINKSVREQEGIYDKDWKLSDIFG